MVTDPIADMLTRIRNAQSRNDAIVEMPYSAKKEAVAKVLETEGVVTNVKSFKYKDSKFKGLSIELKYEDDKPVIQSIQRVSRPGLRSYQRAKDFKLVLGGLGFEVISTSRGVMSSKEARQKRLGGEVLCRIY